MKESYLKYYESYSAGGTLAFLFASFFTRSKLRKRSLMNRQRDYLGLNEKPDLLALHHDLNKELLAARDWPSYDYGEGYFYQSLDLVGITGFRDTRGRVESMNLANRVQGKSVLEIGCNAAFLSLSIAGAASRVVGFDINPHLISIGERTARHLGAENVELEVSSFEDFSSQETFDVVLSFANHSTYDGNTRQSIEDYFRRCLDLTRPGGTLLFESHPPEHEGDGLEGVCAILGELFETEERRVLEYGTFLDRGRTFMVARRR